MNDTQPLRGLAADAAFLRTFLGTVGELAPGGMIGPATLTFLPFPLPDGGLGTEGIITPGLPPGSQRPDTGRAGDRMAPVHRDMTCQSPVA